MQEWEVPNGWVGRGQEREWGPGQSKQNITCLYENIIIKPIILDSECY